MLVNYLYEFLSFVSTKEKEELVRTIRYLESAVQAAITSLPHLRGSDKKLNKDAAKGISIKAVRQSLTSLCQDVVNDPYFTYLKQGCEQYNLQPTDIGLIGNQDVKSIKSWTPKLCINITVNRIYTHIVRVFQCYHLIGIEAIETQIYFGFRKTYSNHCYMIRENKLHIKLVFQPQRDWKIFILIFLFQMLKILFQSIT